MKLYYSIVMLILLSLASVYAEVQTLGTFRVNECVNLKQLGAGFVNCTLISVQYPNSSITTINSLMTRGADGVEYNYTYCGASQVGSYIVNGFCSEMAGDTVWNYDFKITKTGKAQDGLGISMMIGIGIVGLFLFFFAYKLEQEHIILKLLLIFTSITMIMIIPLATFMADEITTTFYRIVLYFFVAFWLYVFGYFIYWILKKFGVIASGGSDEEEED